MRIPSEQEMRQARASLGDRVRETPTWAWRGPEIDRAVGSATEVFLKLELFQFGGTFKPRGALLNILALDDDALARGVTAVSAGNHAIAVAYAAQQTGTSAKVVMIETANVARVEACRDFGAEVVFAPDVHSAFDVVRQIEKDEERAFIHPFNGERTALGTAGVGLELCDAVADLDAVIVPVGGGGLCAGVSTAVKAVQPNCLVFGVEPEGADSMHRSFAAGSPQSIEKVTTIADSLGAPFALEYSFELCRRALDGLVMVSDDEIRAAMRLIFREMKFAVEPAAAAATAALCGPLLERLQGRRVGLIVCGSNIDEATYSQLLAD